MFRAVGNRCAVNFSELRLTISDDEALAILQLIGFRVVEVDIVQLVRRLVGYSLYYRGARFMDAPDIVDCSSLIKWVFARRGSWLPRRTIQQMDYGDKIELADVLAGDVVFVIGHINYYRDDPTQKVGHVGIATGYGTVVHAANSEFGVVESSLPVFVGEEKLRGIRRYISNPSNVVTLETPPELEIESSDDVRWNILQRLPK